jgi:hypothetical protein
MGEAELEELARQSGVSLDYCEDRDHILTRVLLSCQEFTNY